MQNETAQVADDLLFAPTSSEVCASDAQLGELKSLIDALLRWQTYKENILAKLEEADTNIKRLSETDIPDKMFALNMAQLPLADGRKLTVKEKFGINITKANEEAAFQWLEENGHGDIIKSLLSIQFNKEEGETAKALLASLEAQGLSVGFKRSVHPSTLKAWGKEQQDTGAVLPEHFSVYQGKEATIK